jgi:hypothetical protein
MVTAVIRFFFEAMFVVSVNTRSSLTCGCL